MSQKPLYVTRPSLPPLEEFLPYLEQIWDNRILTNNGPFHKELESELCRYLGVDHLSLFTNGTIALVTALQSLRITGEVITTPYSFAATAHSLVWNNIKPIFVDIDPVTCNLDPRKIESAITPSTTAILGVHCYGNPCAVEEIQRIAEIYGLKVIYDAAHAFGVEYKGKSVLTHGDLSVLSFHATKVFNTFEGGAIVCPDERTKQRIDYLKNFGFANELTVVAPGINGKMSEICAAFGLLQLRHIDAYIEKRHRIASHYRSELEGVPGLAFLQPMSNTQGNSSYFPIFIDSKFPLTRDELYEMLKLNGVNSRRYFYPLLSEMPPYKAIPSATASNLTAAFNVANSVLCLPIFSDMEICEVDKVVSLIKGSV